MSLHIETDFPPSLAPLKDMDTLLRCPICFDYLSITMMTKCSHNFCSLCIRKFLSYKLQCPLCNTETVEQDLRNNRLLDDLVSCFQATRQQLSKATFESPPKTPSTPAVSVRCKTPREKTLKSSSAVLSQFFLKKPKASHTKEPKQDGPVTQFKEEPMDVELPSAPVPVAVKQEEMHLSVVSIGVETAHSSSQSKDVKPVIKVECPVCSVSVAQSFINKHLDMCLSSGEKKESLRSSLGKSRRPMAKLVYNLLSLQELKRRLRDCHLSVQGTREQLIKRHQEYIHMYNAQCDSLNPKSAEDIAKEVEANEKMRTKLNEKAKPAMMVFSKSLSEQDIDDMHSNYRKQHSGDFTRLIAQVRGRLQTTRSAGVTAEPEEVNTPPASKSSIVIDSGDSVSEEELCSRGFLTSSPTSSEVSISSSISDIFGPELPQKPETVETTTSNVGKRLRKTRQRLKE